MKRYFEYTVQAKATSKERLIQIVLWLLVPASIALGIINPLFVIAAVAFGAAAWWYGKQLHYEYEYTLNGDEISVAKVINLSRRKELGTISLNDMELFTDDPALVKPYESRPNAKVLQWRSPDGPYCSVIVPQAQGIRIYNLSLSRDMTESIYRWYPMKAKMKY